MKNIKLILALTVIAALLTACGNNKTATNAANPSPTTNILDNAKNTTGDAVDRTGNAANDIGDTAGNIVRDAGDAVGDMADGAGDIANNAIDGAGDAVGLNDANGNGQ